MLFIILLTVQIIIGIVLVGLILVQRSEGGALGMGGGPSGFMSARGAGNFLTKATSILAVLFFANCIGLTIVSNFDRAGTSVVDKVGADNLKLDESQASAAANAQPEASQSSSASVAPSLTDLPAPTNAAPSLGNLGSNPGASSAAASSSSSSVAKPATKPAPKPVAKAPASASASSSEAASQ
ncbi:preprotein translocase subunit SecG [Asticcacaulis sp. BYS171W]|uniref:Protein-export membrane protein SecG n=1 Tax=Asticcacaulis aquaticus TaxID=2984212 RepID=A0ABT5HP54_9CAUL|nr:preprotein translocase subunit SecG [Asticcacaulis aquaticus]MDC7681836.1 preprotein translocase subunit SecG [Asticcacaulis aquaticus]